MQTARRVVLLATTVCAAACDRAPTRVESAPQLSAVVAGDAAAALNPDGSFTRDDPNTFGGQPLITAARARELAMAFVKEYAWLQEVWTESHGAAVRASDLRPCGSTQYVESPYLPIAEPVSKLTSKAYGPRFWVVLCSSLGRRQVLVAIAALATDVVTAPTGLAQAPDHFVTFVATPLPLWWTLPLDAESAALELARLGRARVTSVPRARAVEGAVSFSIAQWESALDRRVDLASSDGALRTLSDSLAIAQDGTFAPELRVRDAGSLQDRDLRAQDVINTGTGIQSRDITLSRSPAARVRWVSARIAP